MLPHLNRRIVADFCEGSRQRAERVRWRTESGSCAEDHWLVPKRGWKMKIRHSIAGLIAGAVLGSGVAMAADSDTDRSNPEAFVKDSAITTKVKAKLTADHMSSLARIHVDTDKQGVVWLSGTVESQTVAANAVQIAKSTEGVRSVHSDIKVEKED
jgi:hyperosmotically inducible protein